MVIKDNENNPLLESAKLIFQALIDDPDYQATDNQTREEVVMGEAIQRANQSHRNNLALSLGSDLEKFVNFIKALTPEQEVAIEDHNYYELLMDAEASDAGREWQVQDLARQLEVDPADIWNLIASKENSPVSAENNPFVEEEEEGEDDSIYDDDIGGGYSVESTPDKLTPELLQANPTKLYLFGDNVQRAGKAGQANVRDEPNAFGIPTKHSPKTTDDAYFSDGDEEIVNEAFNELLRLVTGTYGGGVERTPEFEGFVIPVDENGVQSLGTGLAKLGEKAPAVLEYINKFLTQSATGTENPDGVVGNIGVKPSQPVSEPQPEPDTEVENTTTTTTQTPPDLVRQISDATINDKKVLGYKVAQALVNEYGITNYAEALGILNYIADPANEGVTGKSANRQFSDIDKLSDIMSAYQGTSGPIEGSGATEREEGSSSAATPPPEGITFETTNTKGYKKRTQENATKADMTIAFAINFNTAGEKLTKNSVPDDKHYVPMDLSKEWTDEELEAVARTITENGVTSLNIAGNNITTKNLGSQQDLDQRIYAFVEALQQMTGNAITNIRSGGQTGADEAGAKAGVALGIPTNILATSDWRFRAGDKDTIGDEAGFKKRFENIQAPSTPQTPPESPSTERSKVDELTAHLADEAGGASGYYESEQPAGPQYLDTQDMLKARNDTIALLGDAISNGSLQSMPAIENYRPKGDEQNPREAMKYFIAPYEEAARIDAAPHDLSGSVRPHLDFLGLLNRAKKNRLWDKENKLDEYPIEELNKLVLGLSELVSLENSFSKKMARPKGVNYDRVLTHPDFGFKAVYNHPATHEVIDQLVGQKNQTTINFTKIQNARVGIAQELAGMVNGLRLPPDEITGTTENGDIQVTTWRDLGNEYQGASEILYGENAPLRAVPSSVNRKQKGQLLADQYINTYGMDISPPKGSVQEMQLRELQRTSKNWFQHFDKSGRKELSRGIPKPIISILEKASPQVAQAIWRRYSADPNLYKDVNRWLQGKDMANENQQRAWLRKRATQLYKQSPDWFTPVGGENVAMSRAGNISINNGTHSINQEDLVTLLYLVAPEVRKATYKRNNPRHNHMDAQDTELADDSIIQGLKSEIEKITSLTHRYGGIGDIYLYNSPSTNAIIDGTEVQGNLKLGIRLFQDRSNGQYDHLDPKGFTSDANQDSHDKRRKKLITKLTKDIKAALPDNFEIDGHKVDVDIYLNNDPKNMKGTLANRDSGTATNFIHFGGDYQFNQIPQLGEKRGGKLPFDPFLNGTASQDRLSELLPMGQFTPDGDLTEEALGSLQRGENLSFQLAEQGLDIPELKEFLRRPESEHRKRFDEKFRLMHDFDEGFDDQGNPITEYAKWMVADADHDQAKDLTNLLDSIPQTKAQLRNNMWYEDVLERVVDAMFETTHLIEGESAKWRRDNIKDDSATMEFLSRRVRLQNDIGMFKHRLRDMEGQKKSGEITFDEFNQQYYPIVDELRAVEGNLRSLLNDPANFNNNGRPINGLAVLQQADKNVRDTHATLLETHDNYLYGVKTGKLRVQLDDKGQPVMRDENEVDDLGNPKYSDEQIANFQELEEAGIINEGEIPIQARDIKAGGLVWENQVDENGEVIMEPDARTGASKPVPDLNRPKYELLQTTRTVAERTLGHKGQEYEEPVQILVPHREGGYEGFLKNENQALHNIIWGHEILDDAGNTTHIPGLYLELQNRTRKVNKQTGEYDLTKTGNFKYEQIDSNEPYGFQNLRVDLVWTNPEDKDNTVIIGHMIPANLSEVLASTAFRMLETGKQDFRNFQELYTEDELKNMQWILLPSTAESQVNGPEVIDRRAMKRRMVGDEEWTARESAVDVIDEPEEEEDGVVIRESIQNQIQSLIRLSMLDGVDDLGNPTPEALEIAAEIMGANGYTAEQISNYNVNDVFDTSRQLAESAQESLITDILENDDVTDIPTVDINESGDITISSIVDGEITLVENDNIDDDWSLSSIFESIAAKSREEHVASTEKLWDKDLDSEGYTKTLAIHHNIRPNSNSRTGFYFGEGADEVDENGTLLDTTSDLDSLYLKIRQGLTDKGIFNLADEDAASILLDGILKNLSNVYSDTGQLRPISPELSPVQMNNRMESFKKDIKALTPEARQWFFSEFLSNAYLTEQYFTNMVMNAHGVPAGSDLTTTQKRDINTIRKFTNSRYNFGQSDSLSVQERGRLFFDQMLAEAKAISKTGVFPEESQEYTPRDWRAIQAAAESVALRRFNERVAEDRRIKSDGEEPSRKWQPLEVVSTLQWLANYYQHDDAGKESFKQDIEGQPFQAITNPEKPNEFYKAGDEAIADAKLFFPHTLNKLIEYIDENIVDVELSSGMIADGIDRLVENLVDRGWTAADPNDQDKIPMEEQLRSMFTAQLEQEDDVLGTDVAPHAMRILAALSQQSQFIPLTQEQGLNPNKVEVVLPDHYFSPHGRTDTEDWRTGVKNKFGYYQAIAQALGYSNVKEWLVAENILNFDTTGQTLTKADFNILDQKINRWGKRRGEGRGGGKGGGANTASQTYHLELKEDGSFSGLANKAGSLMPRPDDENDRINTLFTAAQKAFDDLQEGTWSTILNQANLDTGQLSAENIQALIGGLYQTAAQATFGTTKKGKPKLISNRNTPVSKLITELKKLDVRPYGQALRGMDEIGNSGKVITASEGDYGYVARSPERYIRDQVNELLAVVSSVGVLDDTGEDLIITERDPKTTRRDVTRLEPDLDIYDHEMSFEDIVKAFQDAEQTEEFIEYPDDRELLKGLAAENAMLAYIQASVEDIKRQAPDALRVAKDEDPQKYRNVTAEQLGYNSIYVLLNELFAAYFPNSVESQQTAYQGINWNQHISEQGSQEIVDDDRPSEYGLKVSGGKVISQKPATYDLSRLGFFRQYARPYQEDGETGLHMRHDWARIVPKYEYHQAETSDFNYKAYDLVDGYSKVIMDIADNPISYAIFNEDGLWSVYPVDDIDFGEEGELIPLNPPTWNVTGAALDRHYIAGVPEANADGSGIVRTPDGDKLTEIEPHTNTTGQIPTNSDTLEAYFGDKFSKRWMIELQKMVDQTGITNEDIEKYFNENVENWENRTNYALIKQDEIRPGGEPGKRSNLNPFQEWWETERTRQGDEDGGINPVIGKVYPWSKIEDAKAFEQTKTFLERQNQALYDLIFTPEGLLNIDEEGNHQVLSDLHSVLTELGATGLEIDETSGKTQLKKVLTQMIESTVQVLMGTPEAAGLAPNAADAIREFATKNEWDLTGTSLEGESPVTQNLEGQGDPVTPLNISGGPSESGSSTVVPKETEVVTSDTEIPSIEPKEFLERQNDHEALNNIKPSRKMVNEVLLKHIPEQAHDEIKAAIEGAGRDSKAFQDVYFIIRDGHYNPGFLGLDQNTSLTPEQKADILNLFGGLAAYLTAEDRFNYVNKADLPKEQQGTADLITPSYGELNGVEIAVIGSRILDSVNEFFANPQINEVHMPDELQTIPTESRVDPASSSSTNQQPTNQQNNVPPIGASNVGTAQPMTPQRKEWIDRILGVEFDGFTYEEEYTDGEGATQMKRKEKENTRPWHHLQYYEGLDDEKLFSIYEGKYINSPDQPKGMDDTERTKLVNNILNTMKETHILQNPTGQPIEHTAEYLNSLSDKQLRDEDKAQTKSLHEAKLSDAHGRLEHEANHVEPFGKLFEIVMSNPNADNVMQLARELRIHRKKFDNSDPISINNSGKGAGKLWIKPATIAALLEGDESVYGQIKQLINPATGQPYLDENRLDAEEAELEAEIIADGADGQRLLERLEEEKNKFDDQIKQEAANGEAFLKYLVDNQFNYVERNDSLAGIMFTETNVIYDSISGSDGVYLEFDPTINIFNRKPLPNGGISTRSHTVGEDSTNIIFDPKSIPWDQAPMIYNKDKDRIEKAAYWNGMWVNPYVMETVIGQLQNEGDLFLRNPNILNLAREKYDIPIQSAAYGRDPEDVTDDMLRVIIPLEGGKSRPILITQSGRMFELPSNDYPLTAQDGEMTTDQLIGYALSHALGLTLDSPDLERDANGEIAPALLVSQIDEAGEITHIPWDAFTGQIIGEEPDKPLETEEESEVVEGTAAQFLARLRGQPDEVRETTTAVQQLYESNQVPFLRGIVDWVDDIKGERHTHLWRQANNMAIVQEHERNEQAKAYRRAVGIPEDTPEQQQQRADQESREAAEKSFRQKQIGNEYSRLRSEGMSSEEAWATAAQNVEEQLTTPTPPPVERTSVGTTQFDMGQGTPPPVVPEGQEATDLPETEVNIPEGQENIFNQDIPDESLPPFLENRTQKSAVVSLQEFLSS